MLCKCTGLLPVRGLTCALCRQHFGTTARDAAAALGVSKSTLYRIRVRSDGGFAPWPGLATKCALARTVRTPYSDFIGAAKKEVAECKAKLRAAKAAAKSTAPRSTVHFKRMNEGPCAMARRRHGNPQVVQQICSEGSALQWDATAGCYHVLDGEAFESRFDELRRKYKRGEGAQTHNRPFMHMHKHYTLLADDGWSQSDGWAKTGSRFIPVSAACSTEATLTEAKRVRREEKATAKAAKALLREKDPEAYEQGLLDAEARLVWPENAAELCRGVNDCWNSFQRAHKGRSVSTAEWRVARAELWAEYDVLQQSEDSSFLEQGFFSEQGTAQLEVAKSLPLRAQLRAALDLRLGRGQAAEEKSLAMEAQICLSPSAPRSPLPLFECLSPCLGLSRLLNFDVM